MYTENKFKELYVNVESSQQTRLGSLKQPTSDLEIDEDELFLTATRGKKKSRVYDLRNTAPQFYPEAMVSYNVSRALAGPSAKVQEVVVKFEEKQWLATEHEQVVKDQLQMIMEQVQQHAGLPPSSGSGS